MPTLVKSRVRNVPTGVGAGGRAREFEDESIGFFLEVAQVLGIPKSVGQIYGLLFASSRPLSFADIVERLEISKGSASQGLQWLRTLGVVHEVGAGGGRRTRFVPELGLRKLVAGVLREKVEPFVGDRNNRVARLRECANSAGDAVEIRFAQGRVEQIEVWRRQMRMMLPLLRTILGSGHA